MSAPNSASPPGLPRPSWLANQGRLPLAFMGVGLFWFLAAAVLTALGAEQLAYPHLAPPVVALTHAWILGFFVTVAAGAVYQLAPVALGTTLWSERAGWAHLIVHGAAVPVLVVGFWRWNFALLALGAIALLVGAVLFATNVVRTSLLSGRRDAVAWSLGLSAVWLLLTTVAGALLIANRAWAWWALDPLCLLRAHAHIGLVGFFLTLLQGVTFRLVPMFTLGETPDWRPVKAGLWLSQLGLVALAPALAWRQGIAAATAGMLIVAGIGMSGWALRQTLATRKKRHLDVGMRALIRGGIVLLVTAPVGVWLAWPTTSGGSAPGGLNATVYGLAVLIGVLLPGIAGMMGKIVPFLTWMRAYGPKVGRAPTPPATAMSHPTLERWALTLQGLALAPLALGAWTLHVPALTAGAVLLLAGAGLFLANMLLILSHLWRTTTPPAPLTKPLSL